MHMWNKCCNGVMHRLMGLCTITPFLVVLPWFQDSKCLHCRTLLDSQSEPCKSYSQTDAPPQVSQSRTSSKTQAAVIHTSAHSYHCKISEHIYKITEKHTQVSIYCPYSGSQAVFCNCINKLCQNEPDIILQYSSASAHQTTLFSVTVINSKEIKKVIR